MESSFDRDPLLADTPQTVLHRTINHEEIRGWIEARNGKPAQFKGTAGGEDENAPGILAVLFPDDRTETSLETLSWEQFFEKFERGSLVFEYASIGDGHANDYAFTHRD